MNLLLPLFDGQSQKKPLRVGLFDSGLGGLSILQKLQRLAKKSNRSVEFVYFGDTARVPYGSRAVHEVRGFVREIVLWLNTQAVDIIVIACNTSASNAYDSACSVSSVPVLELILPTAKSVSNCAEKIAVMSTVATARSLAFSKAIKAHNADLDVIELGCPDLVPIVEKGLIEEASTIDCLSAYTKVLQQEKIKRLILGCTHFPFLRQPLQFLLGDKVTIIDPANVLIGEEERDMATRQAAELEPIEISWQTSFFVTGDPEAFMFSTLRCVAQAITAKQVPARELSRLTSNFDLKDEQEPAETKEQTTPNLVPGLQNN